MLKYALCFGGSIGLFMLTTMFVYPFIVSVVNVPIAAVIVTCLYIIILTLWNMLVVWYDLDGRTSDSIDVDKEKLFTIHEFRRIHELDYAEFSETVRKMVNDRKLR